MTQSNNSIVNGTVNSGNKYYMSVFQHSPVFYPSDWSSLYIHTLPTEYHTQLQLTNLLETSLCIGKVKRIDLVHKKHKDGEIQYNGFSAFIHFNHWFQNANVDYLRNSIAKHGVCDISGINVSQSTSIGFVDAFGNPVYIRFSKNTKPIPDIEFNSQQISEKLTVAENTIIQQQLRLSTLEYQMSRVMDQLATILAAAGPTVTTTNTVTASAVNASASAATGPLSFESDDEDYSQPLDSRIKELKTENTFWKTTAFSYTSTDSGTALEDNNQITVVNHWTESLPQYRMTMDEVHHRVTIEKEETEPIDPNIREVLNTALLTTSGINLELDELLKTC